MKIQDLRLGNYIELRYENEGYCEVISIDKNGCIDVEYPDGEIIYDRECKFENHEPIPLTEEWLLKFGFIKHHHDYINSMENLVLMLREIETNEWIYKLYPIELGTAQQPKAVNIKSIHQLQNLYFALTSEDLVLKD